MVGAVGLVVQQVFLRWNQGQELRQALITIAISVIIADQVIAHFNVGIAVTVTWPGWTNRLVTLRSSGSSTRSRASASSRSASWSGRALWPGSPHPDRDGNPAGVDDQQMTSALGINVQLTFAIAFVVGSALAAFGGVVSASRAGRVGAGRPVAPQLLVVVIIGGMGSLIGGGGLAALRPHLLVLGRLPANAGHRWTQYSIVVTFILLPRSCSPSAPRTSSGERHDPRAQEDVVSAASPSGLWSSSPSAR